ncbi:MAG: DUF3820 family protein [Verrucomicrobiota bacterium]
MNHSFEAEDDALRSRAAQELAEIGRTVMPFGRFQGRRLHELPAEYLQWFATKGWPRGRIGELMQIVYQMKADGSDVAFDICRGNPGLRRPADS